jgi:hypothetical protein
MCTRAVKYVNFIPKELTSPNVDGDGADCDGVVSVPPVAVCVVVFGTGAARGAGRGGLFDVAVAGVNVVGVGPCGDEVAAVLLLADPPDGGLATCKKSVC